MYGTTKQIDHENVLLKTGEGDGVLMVIDPFSSVLLDVDACGVGSRRERGDHIAEEGVAFSRLSVDACAETASCVSIRWGTNKYWNKVLANVNWFNVRVFQIVDGS